MGGVLAQNGLHFGPKRIAFCPKTEGFLAQNAAEAVIFLAKNIDNCRKSITFAT
jgi:hypothetical protein